MRIVYDIEKLKTELIGKTINWITVTDVFKDERNHTLCRYTCKCGNSKVAPIKVINSGKIKSCGCYRHSKEFASSISEWCKNNPDLVSERSYKYKKWASENRDKIIEQGKRHSQFFKDNPELRDKYRERMISLNKQFNKDASKDIRVSSIDKILKDNEFLTDVIHQDDLANLKLGNIRSFDKIRVKCPICGEHALHNTRDIFNISAAFFKQSRMCKKCYIEFSSSKYEQDIVDFISTFYNGECIRNDRTILNGKELDIYYPEKKIAIEFNGDYWHSDVYKDRLYHYNKLKECLSKDILLVSIFESQWHLNKDDIKLYLNDLFDGVVNKLSFIADCYVNNNYPRPCTSVNDLSYIDHCYKFGTHVVYTCGCSKL